MFVSPSGIIPLPPQCKILKHQRPGVRTSQRLVFVMYKKAASFLYYHDLDVYRTQKTCENVKEKKKQNCLFTEQVLQPLQAYHTRSPAQESLPFHYIYMQLLESKTSQSRALLDQQAEQNEKLRNLQQRIRIKPKNFCTWSPLLAARGRCSGACSATQRKGRSSSPTLKPCRYLTHSRPTDHTLPWTDRDRRIG